MYAPADFERVRRLMRGIIVTQLPGALAQWRQSLKVCVLSTDYVRHPATTAESLAAIVVHELMHARLHAWGIPPTSENRIRIERICYCASQRFLSGLPESASRTAALHDVDQYLSVDTATWQTVLVQDSRPWYLRALVWVVRRATGLRDHEAPT